MLVHGQRYASSFVIVTTNTSPNKCCTGISSPTNGSTLQSMSQEQNTYTSSSSWWVCVSFCWGVMCRAPVSFVRWLCLLSHAPTHHMPTECRHHPTRRANDRQCKRTFLLVTHCNTASASKSSACWSVSPFVLSPQAAFKM